MADQPGYRRGSLPVRLPGPGLGPSMPSPSGLRMPGPSGPHMPGPSGPLMPGPSGFLGGIMRPRLSLIDYRPAPSPDQSRPGVTIMGHPGHQTSTPSITNPEGVPSLRVPGLSKSDPAIDVENFLPFIRRKPNRSISSIPEEFFVRPGPMKKVKKPEPPARKLEPSSATSLKNVEPSTATDLKKPEASTTAPPKNQATSAGIPAGQSHTIAVPAELMDLFKRWKIWDREPEKPEYPWRDDRTEEEKIIPEPDYYCNPYSKHRTHSWLVRTPRPIPPTTVGAPPVRGQPSIRGRRRGGSKRKLRVHNLQDLVKYELYYCDTDQPTTPEPPKENHEE